MAARKLGYSNAKDTIGATLINGRENPTIMTVVGVIDNVYFNSLHNEIRDEIYLFEPASDVISVAYDKDSYDSVRKSVEAIWQRRGEGEPLVLEYFDTIFEAAYIDEQSNSYLITSLTSLAIVIAMLGLYAVVRFALQRSEKEIAIRKILGAKVSILLKLLLGRILMPVLLAGLLAWPIVYYLLSDWLAGFTHRITLDAWYFIIGTSVSLLFGFVVVIGQVVRAAYVHPADVLNQP